MEAPGFMPGVITGSVPGGSHRACEVDGGTCSVGSDCHSRESGNPVCFEFALLNFRICLEFRI
jgi:hypothetical protein